MALSLEKVIITDNLDGGCRTYLEEKGVVVDVKESLSKEDLVREIAVCGPFLMRYSQACTQTTLI